MGRITINGDEWKLNVQVPGSLLLDRHLSRSAKLLWILLHLPSPGGSPPASTRFLQARSGLARPTVLRGLVELESTGWLGRQSGPQASPPTGQGMPRPPSPPTGQGMPRPPSPQASPQASPQSSQPPAPQSWAALPEHLVLDKQLGMSAKLVYGALQLTAGFRAPAGQFKYSELRDLTSLCANTLIGAVRALQKKGWIETTQKNKYSPIQFVLRNPVVERQQREVAEARLRLEEAPYLREALMREYLTLIVENDEYDDNASPGYLINPFTGEEMQFDRYYPPRVAFEFNGPQHYGPTERYVDEVGARKQRGRDYVKAGICADRGVTLVVLHPADLTLATIRAKVNGLLPLRDLGGHEPLIAYLDMVSRTYRRKVLRDLARGCGGPT